MTDRAAVEAEIATLEREQGASLLDGKDFDPATLSDARNRLAAIDQASQEAERRQRQETNAVVAARRAEIALEGAEAAKQYRAALEAAETHAQGLSEALGHILGNAAYISRRAYSLGIRTRPDLDRDALEKLLSQALGASLAPCARQQRRFGYFEWPATFTPQTFTALDHTIPDFEEGA